MRRIPLDPDIGGHAPRIDLRLPARTLDALDERARRRGLPRAEIVRELLDLGLKREARTA